ncbi:hypothetical protein RND81_08G209500 [Saponaria officinalis]|uniref:Uncharacterized protein n=1 Tax=Saponaria officinalis TaxID=3572 RepID=A0AAW1JAG3_SAPOF
MGKSNEAHSGFWGTIARKAKAILDDDDVSSEFVEAPTEARQRGNNVSLGQQHGTQNRPSENHKKPDKAMLRKGFGAITSSFNYLGNALEEGLNIVENRTADIIQETRSRRLNVRKKAAPDLNSQPVDAGCRREPSGNQVPAVAETEIYIQLQASRDVAMAMAAKTKLLLRELKTVKADLAFAKERCAQLEEENRILRDSMEKGASVEDDDLVRLQLETLLAEKARLNLENAEYARENRFLREVVEYHQLKMQDVIYLNERNEEITQV